MLATALIVFREILEASLVVSIVLAATKGVPGRVRWVIYGIGAGVLGAVTVAAFAGAIADLAAGMGQEVFNACVMFTAAAMLGWHSIWMARHGRDMAREMRAVGTAVVEGARPPYALAIVVGLAVLREGSEVALFLYGIAAGDPGQAGAMALGGALGAAGGVALGLTLYAGLLQISTKHLFAVTNWMIILLAAGMAGQGAAYLVDAEFLPALGDAVWNTSHLLADSSMLGKALHTLIGYSAQPSGMQIAAYLATLAVISLLKYRFGAPKRPAGTAASAA